MFTGLIERVGHIDRLHPMGGGRRLSIRAPDMAAEVNPGDSVAVNGACLTRVGGEGSVVVVEAVAETLNRTTLGSLQVGDPVNLERSLRAEGRLDGHFVQGHIDGTGRVVGLETRDPGLWLEVELSADLTDMCVEKGSIALDGISLTIASLSRDRISVAVIPHTIEHTTLKTLSIGHRMNIEVDILGKYVKKFTSGQNHSGLSLSSLKDWGY